ncbi:TRAP transporter small permease subunit [Sagittula stellata]|uniref:TRAP transporter small permease protein n=1 Tax=Sagittula stellata (strain ATCC 700073 / DSM 11524 / E-37) TaxID=388399 RepID=A3K7Z3_SAGS3|nr:TRAP transporter small permease [Sagittula stellata]EBA06765.1 TRAP-T family transporter, DctQ (4 TMs) subunit [Sagittula stellata E-37]
MIWLDRIERALAAAMMMIGCLALIATAFHVTASVVMRYAFNTPLNATLEIGTFYYMVAISFLPLAYTQLGRGHITVDFVAELLPARANKVLQFIADCLMLVFLVLLTRGAWISAIEATRHKEYAFTAKFDLLLWPSRWILVAAMVAFVLVLLAQIVRSVAGRGNGMETP